VTDGNGSRRLRLSALAVITVPTDALYQYSNMQQLYKYLLGTVTAGADINASNGAIGTGTGMELLLMYPPASNALFNCPLWWIIAQLQLIYQVL